MTNVAVAIALATSFFALGLALGEKKVREEYDCRPKIQRVGRG